MVQTAQNVHFHTELSFTLSSLSCWSSGIHLLHSHYLQTTVEETQPVSSQCVWILKEDSLHEANVMPLDYKAISSRQYKSTDTQTVDKVSTLPSLNTPRKTWPNPPSPMRLSWLKFPVAFRISLKVNTWAAEGSGFRLRAGISGPDCHLSTDFFNPVSIRRESLNSQRLKLLHANKSWSEYWHSAPVHLFRHFRGNHLQCSLSY